ncbi:D-alanyl-D-alanine carboxypeptidase/D-alanyl-D-alanine-endopeptidase [Alkalihalophilus pseudofirmus]|nr:D-alanyl-D-alanine carboxypeptidase/D-alanyl-D-alanine-endopeptidase [Alkalihalophilus pseudofirmus]
MKQTKAWICFSITIFLFLFSFYLHTDHIVKGSDRKQWLIKEIDQILLENPSLDGALASVSIRSGSTGEVIYDYNGNIRLKPASNLKILTAVAALNILGEDYRFKTELLTDGKVRWGILNGNLYIRGKGDVTLLPTDMDEMAKQLQRIGVKIIRGDLIGDDTWYDNVRYSIDLPWSDETMRYGSPISALTVSSDKDYDAGTVKVEIVPARQMDQKASITVHPNNNYFEIINNIKTVSSEDIEDIVVTREHGTNRVIVDGQIPISATKFIVKVAVWEPTEYALHLFQQSLKDNGIKLLGDKSRGITPEDTCILTSHKSVPLFKLLIPFMKLSNNGHGDTLMKEIGKVVKGDGNWENGLEVTKEALAQYGVNTETIILRDGSGISHVNLIPTNEISLLLYSIQKEKWFTTFLHSLPVAGVSNKMVGGTLKNRMKDTDGRVKAKTGTLATVSSISGYVETKSGENLIFSIVINNMMENKNGKKLEDQIVTTLVNF